MEFGIIVGAILSAIVGTLIDKNPYRGFILGLFLSIIGWLFSILFNIKESINKQNLILLHMHDDQWLEEEKKKAIAEISIWHTAAKLPIVAKIKEETGKIIRME